MFRLNPEIVSHAVALIITVALAGMVVISRIDRTIPVTLSKPALQIALEAQPAALPQPAEEHPRAPEPRLRPAPHRDHPDAKRALPLMAEIQPSTTGDANAVPDAPASEAAAAPSGSEAASSATLEAQYASTLRTNIDSRTTVPNSIEYRLKKPQGEAHVAFTLDRRGSMLDSALAKSSGSGVLDRQALNIVQTGRYPPFPDAAFRGESRHSFIVTLEFHL